MSPVLTGAHVTTNSDDEQVEAGPLWDAHRDWATSRHLLRLRNCLLPSVIGFILGRATLRQLAIHQSSSKYRD